MFISAPTAAKLPLLVAVACATLYVCVAIPVRMPRGDAMGLEPAARPENAAGSAMEPVNPMSLEAVRSELQNSALDFAAGGGMSLSSPGGRGRRYYTASQDTVCRSSELVAHNSGCGTWGDHQISALTVAASERRWNTRTWAWEEASYGDAVHVERCRAACDAVGWCQEFFTHNSAWECHFTAGTDCTDDGNTKHNWYRCGSAEAAESDYAIDTPTGTANRCSDPALMATHTGCGTWGTHMNAFAPVAPAPGLEVGNQQHYQRCQSLCEAIGWCEEFFVHETALYCALTAGKDCTEYPLAGNGWQWYRCDTAASPERDAKDKLSFNAFEKTSAPDLSYPITAKTVAMARSSNAVSMRTFGSGQLAKWSWRLVQEMIHPLPLPSHPDSIAAQTDFWSEFEFITELQVQRGAGATAASVMDLPDMFKHHTMAEAAAAVEKDFPSEFPTALCLQFLEENVTFDGTVIPHNGDDFVNKVVMLSELVGWAVSTVSPVAFASKWHEGRMRPEEVALLLTRDPTHQLAAHGPGKIAQSNLGALNLDAAKSGFDYTAYDFGAPKHPSWPAMHSAASSASLYLAVVLDLTPSQLREARLLDCAVASFRSIAGVHYESDNMAGLAIGQEVLRRELPSFLSEHFGSDEAVVRAKIDAVIAAHDWRTAASCFRR